MPYHKTTRRPSWAPRARKNAFRKKRVASNVVLQPAAAVHVVHTEQTRKEEPQPLHAKEMRADIQHLKRQMEEKVSLDVMNAFKQSTGAAIHAHSLQCKQALQRVSESTASASAREQMQTSISSAATHMRHMRHMRQRLQEVADSTASNAQRLSDAQNRMKGAIDESKKAFMDTASRLEATLKKSVRKQTGPHACLCWGTALHDILVYASSEESKEEGEPDDAAAKTPIKTLTIRQGEICQLEVPSTTFSFPQNDTRVDANAGASHVVSCYRVAYARDSRKPSSIRRKLVRVQTRINVDDLDSHFGSVSLTPPPVSQ